MTLPVHVEPLKRIDVILQLDQNRGMFQKTCSLSFIYGIGTRGLTPLELRLADQPLGAIVQAECPPDNLAEFMGHLAPADLRLPLENRALLTLTITIQNITTPPDRDIVKAVAELSRCGDCCGH